MAGHSRRVIYSKDQNEGTPLAPAPNGFGVMYGETRKDDFSHYEAGAEAKDIAAIGITNQRETSVIWDKETGEPIYNAIVWQCRRTSEIIDRLVEGGYSEMIREKTGLVPDAYFRAQKLSGS